MLINSHWHYYHYLGITQSSKAKRYVLEISGFKTRALEPEARSQQPEAAANGATRKIIQWDKF